MQTTHSPLKIVVASGKGGTGKTTVATSLALSLAPAFTIRFLDCDVEAPNAHLFLRPTLQPPKEVGTLIPQVDETRCTHCGTCADVCRFNAITVLGGKTLVFPELCHGCGSCTLVCPEGAITETLYPTGVIETGDTPAQIEFARGVLNVGEPMAVPVIRQLKTEPAAKTPDITIIDSPPGTSCPVVETMDGADYAILVTEPTPFGLHDLQLMLGVVAELGLPAGVIINRDGVGNAPIEQVCAKQGVPVLMRIPLQRNFGAGIAQGQPLTEIDPAYKTRFAELLTRIKLEIGGTTQ